MNDLIKKWVKCAGLELVSLEEAPERRMLATVRIPGQAEPVLCHAFNVGELESLSERAVESRLAYEVENLSAALHVDWHLRGLRTLEPDAVLLQLHATCPCGGRRIVEIKHKERTYRCERGIDHAFPPVTVIPHDGLVAVLYADVAS